MNIPLLTDVKFNILAVPETFEMYGWFTSRLDSPCGTAGCIAGHTVAVVRSVKTLAIAREGVNDHIFWSETREIAGEALELDSEQQIRLFFVRGWPLGYARKYNSAKTPFERSVATAARIDWFIKTNGAE